MSSMRVCGLCGKALPKDQFPYTDRSRTIRSTSCHSCRRSERRKKRLLGDFDDPESPLDIVQAHFARFAVDEGLDFSDMDWEKVLVLIREARQAGMDANIPVTNGY